MALIAPFARGAHQALGGLPPLPIETMLRIPCLQLWCSLSDRAMEEELQERPLYRRFAGLDGAKWRAKLTAFSSTDWHWQVQNFKRPVRDAVHAAT